MGLEGGIRKKRSPRSRPAGWSPALDEAPAGRLEIQPTKGDSACAPFRERTSHGWKAGRWRGGAAWVLAAVCSRRYRNTAGRQGG